jgi:PAS domain-containing protein
MENELSRVVDALPELVWTALPDGRIDFVNQRWREYTGLSVDEAYGQRWQTAIHIIEAVELIRSEMAGVTLEAFEPGKRKRWLLERGIETSHDIAEPERLRVGFPVIHPAAHIGVKRQVLNFE